MGRLVGPEVITLGEEFLGIFWGLKGGDRMAWKCVPQIKGLVRGEPKPGSRRRANGLKICMEAGNERASKSKTLDRSRSKNNTYSGPKSGKACWEMMEAEADEYRVTGTTKTGKQFARRLPPDAVIGWALIFKPPAEVVETWTPEQKVKFHNDSWKVMKQIEPRLFSKKNLRHIAWHRDEDGDHTHVIGSARDEDGKYCGNLVDCVLLQKINELYPAMMRKLDWDIEDAEITDWKRYDTDPEYAAAVDAKRAGSGGLSVNDYMAKQAAERAEAAAAMYGDAVKALQEAQKAAQEARKDREAIRDTLDRTRRLTAAGEAQEAELAARRQGHRRRLPGE